MNDSPSSKSEPLSTTIKSVRTVLGFLTLIVLSISGILAVLVVTIRIWRAHTLRKRTPTFDVVTSEATTLNLSEALS